MRGHLRLVAAALLLSACAAESPFFPSPVDSSMLVGVSVHSPAPAGLDIVRRDEDRLTWLPQARSTGATPLVIVGYGDESSIPERCAKAAATGSWIELWNEPNLPQFWGYDADRGLPGNRAPNPERWVELLRGCRAAAPDAMILGPALGGSKWDWEFLRRVTAAGLTQYVDVVTVHGYATAPGDLSRDIAKVRSITGAQRVGISEWGVRSGGSQARDVEQALFASADAGLEFVVFYHGHGELGAESIAVLQRFASDM